MRTVVHLSDLHFGKVDVKLLEPLRRRVLEIAPDVVVVSGDLTQRAKPEEFRQARAYLDTLPKPQVIVPGNHDIPLYNVFQRFFSPLDKYRRYISAELETSYIDGELGIVGVNTARSLVFKGGRINEDQVERVKDLLCKLPEEATKIVVTHHPFDMPDDWDDQHQVVGHAAMALKALARCGADVYISGHMHKAHAGEPSFPFDIGGFRALMVAAGTATSTRSRGESNSFNALRVSPRHIAVESYEWDERAGEFNVIRTANFHHTPQGWESKPGT
jgi:3',5'-cyclic AMP phosphodiesterase CpdA